MKMKILVFSILMLLLPHVSHSADYSFSLGDLGDLAHGKYITYGINSSLAEIEQIVYADIFIDDIYNWTVEDMDRLYIHLLESSPSGIQSATDTVSGDQFASSLIDNTLLAPGSQTYTYTDPTDTIPEDFLYVLDSDELLAFNNYAQDGNFGLGFDPDCHYYNSGVYLRVKTAAVPEPASLALLIPGILSLLGLRNKKLL